MNSDSDSDSDSSWSAGTMNSDSDSDSDSSSLATIEAAMAAPPARVLSDVIPEAPLAKFSLTLVCLKDSWQRDFRRKGNDSGQTFNKALATEIGTKVLTTLFGPLHLLTVKERKRVWETIPGLLVMSDGKVQVTFDSDIKIPHPTKRLVSGEAKLIKKGGDIDNNKLSAVNVLKVISLLAYVAHECPPLVTLRLSDTCGEQLQMASAGKTKVGDKWVKTLSDDKVSLTSPPPPPRPTNSPPPSLPSHHRRPPQVRPCCSSRAATLCFSFARCSMTPI